MGIRPVMVVIDGRNIKHFFVTVLVNPLDHLLVVLSPSHVACCIPFLARFLDCEAG